MLPAPVSSRLSGWLRKAGPYLLFLMLGFCMLYGQRALLALTSWAHGVGPAVASANMSSAEVAADAQAAGWVPAGTVTSKLVTAGGAFLFMVILSWLTQQLTHPAPTDWAKKTYSSDFDALTGLEKFTVYQRIRQNYTWLAAGALLFAALVQ